MTSNNQQGHGRITWDFSQAGRYKFKMDFSPDGQQWHQFMEGDYNRQD
jgi:hypothetical protein